MVIRIKRHHHLSTETIGHLQIEGKEHRAIFTLENPKRPERFDDRIPAGTYQCIPYSGTKYKNVYLVQNVPNRTGILFHWGNTEKHTLGCILLGFVLGKIGNENAVLDSVKCFEYFRKLVGKNKFTLIIED